MENLSVFTITREEGKSKKGSGTGDWGSGTGDWGK